LEVLLPEILWVLLRHELEKLVVLLEEGYKVDKMSLFVSC
jgi:hypothetical protein